MVVPLVCIKSFPEFYFCVHLNLRSVVLDFCFLELGVYCMVPECHDKELGKLALKLCMCLK